MNRGKLQFQGNSLPEAFYNKVKEDPDADFFATKRNGSWESLKRSEALDFVLRNVSGLERLGFSAGDRICIFSENREEWILTDYSAQWLRGSTTSIYSTSSEDEIESILKNAEPKVIFVSDLEMLQKLGNISRHSDFIKAVVCWEPVETKPSGLGSIELIQRDEFLKTKKDEETAKGQLSAIRGDDLCILLYTSGTTGEPKGVMLTQFNMVSNVRQMQTCMPFDGMTRTMSFLPLSHIYERSLHTTLLLANIKIFFVEDLDKLVEDVQEACPDIMIGVPRVFEKMYVKIHDKLKDAPWHKQLLAKLAFGVGEATVPYRLQGESLPMFLKLPYQALDQLIFKKIRAITGGRLKYFVSGGAPLSQEIGEFFFSAGITILEGYGLSETSIVSVNRPGQIRFGTVGLAFDETEFRIADDGEILIRGPQVMKGYFKREDLTAEVMTEDGFFKTGDIGQLDSQGFLKITDRKKELIITAAGKNVAPQPIENKLKADPLIEQVCVVGDRRKYLTALIVPNLELCQKWALENGEKQPQNLNEVAALSPLQKRIQRTVDEVNDDLGRFATLKYFHSCANPFTIEEGELTPTMKLKRRVINDRYAEAIEKMYPAEDRIAI